MNCVEAKVSKGDAGTAGAADDDKKRKSGTNLGGVTFVEDKRLRACDALARFGPVSCRPSTVPYANDDRTHRSQASVSVRRSGYGTARGGGEW